MRAVRSSTIMVLLLFAAVSKPLVANAQRTSGSESLSKYLTIIDRESRADEYRPWRSKLVAFYEDSHHIFIKVRMVEDRCASRKSPPKKICDWAGIRTSMALGSMLAITAIDSYRQDPYRYKHDVAPQVIQWLESGFTDDLKTIRHYSKNSVRFDDNISRAQKLAGEAKESADVGDWLGAIISLRHSQLLMTDSRTEALESFDEQ